MCVFQDEDNDVEMDVESDSDDDVAPPPVKLPREPHVELETTQVQVRTIHAMIMMVYNFSVRNSFKIEPVLMHFKTGHLFGSFHSSTYILVSGGAIP